MDWKQQLLQELINQGIVRVDDAPESSHGDACPCHSEELQQVENKEDTADMVKDHVTPEEKQKGSFMSKKVEVEIRDGKEKATVEINDNGNITQQEFDTLQEALDFFNSPQDRDQIQNTQEKVEELEEKPEEKENDIPGNVETPEEKEVPDAEIVE
jgi:hypothetical protein